MSRALKQALHVKGADTRLQLKEALAGLHVKELQAQSVWTVEHLLQQIEPQQLDGFIRDLFCGVKECSSPSIRRLCYRLAAYALKVHATKHWGQTLLYVRDKVIERIGHEENPATAQELQAVMQQLTAACIEAYCHKHFTSLSVASKEELPREWLCQLLILPLLRAACRGPLKTKLSNGCLFVDGVLAAFKKWAKSAAVLHAAVECLKEMLRLAGVVTLCAGEFFLPIQSCITLLGARLKVAAVHNILRVVVMGMERREDWQVRKSATESLTMLVTTVLQQQKAALQGGAREQSEEPLDSGLAALVQAQQRLMAAVEEHVKYDRIPQVRQAAVALSQELQRLSPPPRPAAHGDRGGAGAGRRQQGKEQPYPAAECDRGSGSRQGTLADQAGPVDVRASLHQAGTARLQTGGSPSGPLREASLPRFTGPYIPSQQRRSLDFGVQVFEAPPPLHVGHGLQEGQQQVSVLALPSTASQLMEGPCQPSSDYSQHGGFNGSQQQHERPPDGICSGRASPQAAIHHVVHPLFDLRVQEDPPAISIRPAGDGLGTAVPATALNTVDVWLEDMGSPSGPRVEVEIGMQADRSGRVGSVFRYTLHRGQLLQHALPGASAGQPASQPGGVQLHSSADIHAPVLGACPAAASGSAGPCSTGSSTVRLAKMAAAGRTSVEIGMDSPAKKWAETLHPIGDAAAPLLQQPLDCGQPEQAWGALLSSRPQSQAEKQQQGLDGSNQPQSPAKPQLYSQPGSPWLGLAMEGQDTGMPRSPSQQRCSGPQGQQAPIPSAASGAAPWQERNSSPSNSSPHQRAALEHPPHPPSSTGHGRRSPAPSSSLASPQHCDSPPYTPAMQQQGTVMEASQPKGPLTAMVTKALSRLQQLQELQHWQDTVSNHITSSGGQQQTTSEASSVKQGNGFASKAADTEDGRPSDLQGAFVQADAQSGSAGGLMGMVQPRWSLEPSLSAIPEASERSNSSGGMRPEAEVSVGWVPADDDDEMRRLVQLQQKLEASMRQVQKRIQEQALPSSDSIPAAWPQRGEGPAEEGGLDPRPASRESGASSQRYSTGEEAAPGNWQHISNPLFNTSRPGTALSMQEPTLHSEDSELAVGQALAAQGLQSQQHPCSDVAEGGSSAASQQQYHDSFRSPASQQQASGAVKTPPSLSEASSGQDAAHSGHSLGSEFEVAGQETEEEVASFLRGSISNPLQQQASPFQRRQCRLPSTVLAAAANAANMKADCPPRPPPAALPATCSGGMVPGPSSFPRKERPRWSNLGAVPQDAQPAHGTQHSHPWPRSPERAVSCSHATSPSHGYATAAARQAVAQLRSSIDLDAILDSCEPSPEASTTSSAGTGIAAMQRGAADEVADSGFEGGAGRRPASAKLQRLQVTSRPAPRGFHSSVEEAGQGSISQVLCRTFPDDALERLDQLRARLSPTHPQHPPASRSASPSRPAHNPGSQQGSAHSPPAPLMPHESKRPAPGQLDASSFALRPPSPAAPGLPVSRRQAALLPREALRRLARNPSASQATPDIQGALTEALERHAQDVQAYYHAKQEAELALLNQQCGDNLDLLHRVLQREGEVLKALSQQAARGEVQRFVEETLPRLADVLTSKELLLRCWDLLEEVQ